MKTYVFAFAMLTMATAAVVGQSKEIVDDIYFKPSDVIKQTERPIARKPVYKNGAKEIVFIERGQKVEIVTPDTTILLGEANDSTEQDSEEGYYMNGFNGSKSDLEYANRIRKFHNPKYRVFIGDPAYNDIYFLNNFDWNVYVGDNYAYVTPTWTNPYWFDYSFRPYSSWGWNSWGYGNSYYGGYYGWGNYPWSYNNYWGGYGGYYGYGGFGGYGGYYGGMYGSYYGSMYGYGMGYPYYGYGGYNHGFYDGYYYGNYNNGGYNNSSARSTGSGSRQPSSSRTTIGGGGTFRDASGVRSSTNYTAVGGNNRSVVSTNGSRSIRSAADFQNRTQTGTSTNRTITERNTNAIVNGGDRQTGIRTTENNYRSTSGYTNSSTPRTGNSITTRESGVRSTYTAPRVSTTPRTGNAEQPNQGARSNYSSGSSNRSSYSTGTPAVTRESRSGNSVTPSTSTRSSYNSSSNSSYRSSTPSYSSGSSSYSSGSSSGGGSSSSSSGGSSSGGGRR